MFERAKIIEKKRRRTRQISWKSGYQQLKLTIKNDNHCISFFLLCFVITLLEQESRLLRDKQNQTYYRSGSRSRGAQRRAKPGCLLPANSTGHASVFCGIKYEIFRQTRTAY